MIYIELLGRVRVSFGTLRETLELRHQSLVLLAYFALLPSRRAPREVLVERFWPGQSPKTGQRCLSSAIWRLRSALYPAGSDIIVGDEHGEAGFADAAHMWLDAGELCSAIKPALSGPSRLDEPTREALVKGLDLYRGDLLDGYYDDWVLAERERLRAFFVRGCLRLLDHHASGGDWGSALEYGHSVLRLDPLREDVHRRVMELYINSGDRAGARRQYCRLVQLLTDELGVGPAPETQAILEDI